MKRTWIALFVACGTFAQADIAYKVEVMPEKETLHVTMLLPNTQAGSRLQMPNWSPGAYVIRDGFTAVLNFKATGANGSSLKVDTDIQTLQKPY